MHRSSMEVATDLWDLLQWTRAKVDVSCQCWKISQGYLVTGLPRLYYTNVCIYQHVLYIPYDSDHIRKFQFMLMD